MLHGRPHRGVAILWRHSAFPSVKVIPCDNPRLCAIQMVLRDRMILVISLYMPVEAPANLVEFRNTLASVSAIIDSCSIDCVYILGDFKAHPTEQFYKELVLFSAEQEWSCIDVEMMINCFTFVSEVHGSQRCLDHCVVSKGAVSSVRSIYVKYDILWSDHYPLVIECNLNVIAPRIYSVKPISNEVMWGDRGKQQTE